jgi:dienelactone hydrolase
MLAACETGGKTDRRPRKLAHARRPRAHDGGDHVSGQEGRALRGSFAAPQGNPKGSVLIIHENRGLTAHFVALREGSPRAATALAVDLLWPRGTAGIGDDARYGRA